MSDSPFSMYSNVLTEEERQLLVSDFRNFYYAVCKYLNLPEPSPLKYDIADYLQKTDGCRIIQAARGYGKSYITCIYVVWRLFCNPNLKFLIVSATHDFAKLNARFIKRIINEVPFLQHMKPRKEKEELNSVIQFDVANADLSRDPSVKCAGIFGQITGSRADEIIADDVEIPKNSLTEDAREKLLRACDEFIHIIKGERRITYLGTPQSFESIYDKLRKVGYQCRIWPGRYPTKDKIPNYGGALAPMILEGIEEKAGQSTDPICFPEEILAEKESKFTSIAEAQLQIMLDTTMTDALKYPLRTSDLIVMDLDSTKAPITVQYASSEQHKDLVNVGFSGDRFYKPMYIDPQWIPYDYAVMAIDCSGRGKDETAYAVVKSLHSHLYVTAAGGLQGGYEDNVIIRLAKMAADQKVNLIIIESNFGDGMFTKLFTPVLHKFHKCGVEEVRATTQKERRIIDTLEPVLNQHKLVVDKGVVKADLAMADSNIQYSLIYQLTHITRDKNSLKHDDRLDALAMAVGHFKESLQMDEKKALEAYRKQVVREWLKEATECSRTKRPRFYHV